MLDCPHWVGGRRFFVMGKARSRKAARVQGTPLKDAAPADRTPSSNASRRFVIAFSAILVVAVWAVYWQTLRFGYVYFDDDRYVYDNRLIRAGLSAKSIAWAFTTFYFANWHPLTWLSYLADFQFFGLNAGAEHAVNIAWHAGAAVLLFLALVRMTKQGWQSALVAAIFALHPLHVESVAWIAERKDVLSTFFQMLTLLLYARYAEKGSPIRYVGVALAYALSLLSKPMAVTLPFVMLLLDLWPLRRLDLTRISVNLKRLLWEKAPLFAMSAASSVVTFIAQRRSGAVISITALPFTERLANALVAYLRYIGKALWPVDLAVLYPFEAPSTLATMFAVIVLAVITVWSVREVRAHPYFLVGWLWYLGTLVPVIGLIQVGAQSMADRYTYLPLVGLSIACVWGIRDLAAHRPALRTAAATIAAFACVAFGVIAYVQARYWESSETLFRHTLAITHGNIVTENNLGVVLQREGRRDEAAALYREALSVTPNDPGPQTNLGVILAGGGKHQEAIDLYQRALASDPSYVDAHINLGKEMAISGQFDSARSEYSEALRLNPDSAAALAGMGVALAAQGKFDEAAGHLNKAVELDGGDAESQSNLCFVLVSLKRLKEAGTACDAALRLKPDSLDARFNRANILAAQGQTAAAIDEFSRILAADPNYSAARAALEGLQKGGPR